MSTPTTNERVAAAFSRAMDVIEAELEALKDAKRFDDGDIANKVTKLVSAMTRVVGEQRKLEKMEAAAIKELTHAVVIAWARMQTPAGRSKLVKELIAVDDPKKKSVLG